ncbi:Murein DD-endopeptidase MepM and murein hydrolase activator NlpD, contain LysM domain [Oceanobacillus limi]|uniref:Murein DD-endopeptidase MepM and murein hydrolase activator NlpD, contain LysM domain n=1 Tax=Oceanobacillus limi TaxID=930131 RepID=A0A1I0CYP0_9BACI|nr:M23 family metallopeptidase [Oceanobacillus limi]SET24774.1 Murein DD-endopeptidase MepM and murein hydrolase activator NlpD, contain LysM domain [Oceanobacillus limi]
MFYQKNKKQKSSFLKRVSLATCFGLVFTYGIAFAEEDGDVETVHHVYIDGEHIGKVSDPEIVERAVEDTIEEGKQEYADENLTITVGEDVSLVSERVFKPTVNNDSVANLLEDELTVKAETIELKIGDDVVGHFNDQASAEEVVTNYKKKFVDEEILEELNQNNSSVDEPLTVDEDKKKDLKIGDSIILDVQLSEEVSFSTEKVAPKKVLTVKQGVKLLEKGTLKEEKHKVKEGEVLGQIAANYNLSTDELLDINPDLTEDSILQIDQEINVTDYKPFVDVVVHKEEKKEETIDYQTETVESDELYKGEQTVKQEGSEGKKEVHYEIEIRNGKVTQKEVLEESVTKEPVNKVVVKGTKVIPSRGTGSLSWPAVGGYISSHVGHRWGKMHKGIDIARPSNRSILAADNGVVTEARYDGSYGNKVVIDHNNGIKTLYAHLSSINVSVGQTVEKGKKIGVMGTTGNVTGLHLHFEVHKNGSVQNPVDYLN